MSSLDGDTWIDTMVTERHLVGAVDQNRVEDKLPGWGAPTNFIKVEITDKKSRSRNQGYSCAWVQATGMPLQAAEDVAPPMPVADVLNNEASETGVATKGVRPPPWAKGGPGDPQQFCGGWNPCVNPIGKWSICTAVMLLIFVVVGAIAFGEGVRARKTAGYLWDEDSSVTAVRVVNKWALGLDTVNCTMDVTYKTEEWAATTVPVGPPSAILSAVTATLNGGVVKLSQTINEGWLHIGFDLPPPAAPEQVMKLKLSFTMPNPLCEEDQVTKFAAVWSNRWVVPVESTTYIFNHAALPSTTAVTVDTLQPTKQTATTWEYTASEMSVMPLCVSWATPSQGVGVAPSQSPECPVCKPLDMILRPNSTLITAAVIMLFFAAFSLLGCCFCLCTSRNRFFSGPPDDDKHKELDDVTQAV